MNLSFLWLCLFFVFLCVSGVFSADRDEVKSVSVMEGESVTLPQDDDVASSDSKPQDDFKDVFNAEGDEASEVEEESVGLHTDTAINELVFGDSVARRSTLKKTHTIWTFGTQNTLIAEIVANGLAYVNNNTEFHGRIKLNSRTGSLTISNIRATDSGLYTCLVVSPSFKVMPIKFNVIVYASLSTPNVRNSTKCTSVSKRSSSSKCVLLCSVMNVTQVTLSWYKGNSLLSSISVSDLNTLSLPLEVEYQDTNTYSCVVNNRNSKQTKHLNITDHCQLCSEPKTSLYLLVLIPVILALALIGGICAYWKYGNERQVGCCCNRSHSVLKCCNVNWGPNSPLV